MSKIETINQLAGKFGTEAKKRLGDASIIGPWDNSLSKLQRASEHMYLLEQAYGKGHPGCQEPIDSLMNRQTSGNLLTWIIYWRDSPVGMANLEITKYGIGELCRTVELPIGTAIDNGAVYDGEAKISAVAYQRLADALTNPEITKKIWALEADLRTAKAITLPSGKTLEPGVKTQHINSGLRPMLLAVPRYEVSPENGHSHQEVFSQSRLYFEPEKISRNEPIYTPKHNSFGPISIADITKNTYFLAFGFSPKICDEDNRIEEININSLENTAGPHFSTLYASGEVSDSQLLNRVLEGLQISRFLEIIIPNQPGNINLQDRLYRLGFIPLGVMPGGQFTLNGGHIEVPTTIHFGTARRETIKKMVEVELAKEYADTPINELTHALREEWRKKI